MRFCWLQIIQLLWIGFIWTDSYSGTMALQAADVYKPHCREALGMNSGAISDTQVTASSSHDIFNVGPPFGRIRLDRRGGAWCPGRPIGKGIYEYLEIDLGEIKEITLVETQGRFNNGQGQEYTEYYILEYQRLKNSPWVRYKDRYNKEVFEGNSNTYIAEVREVNPPIVAQRIRFVPFSESPRSTCMRVEVYGCHWKEGILSYTVRQGDRRGNEVNLVDNRYDGNKLDNGILSGGLGQLTDEEEGITNFRLAPNDISKKGYEWIGWKNDSGDPVEMTFSFDHVREFSQIQFHCNNYPEKDVLVFHRAEIEFSIGGVYYVTDAVVYEYLKDTLISLARKVSIKIPNKVGKFVKIKLYFEARWMMISEVYFQSVIAKGRYAAETSPRPTTPGPSTAAPQTTKYVTEKIVYPDIQNNKIPMDNRKYPKIFHSGKKRNDRNRMKTTYRYPVVERPEVFEENVVRPKIFYKEPENSDKPNKFPEAYIGIIIGMVAAVILIVISIVFFLVIRQQRKKKSTENMNDIYEKQNPDLNNYPGARSSLGPASKPLVPNYNMFNNSMTVSETDMEEELIQRLKGKPALEENYDKRRSNELREENDSGRGPSPLYVQLPNDPVFNNINGMPNITTNPMYLHHPNSTPPIQPPPPIPPPLNNHVAYDVTEDPTLTLGNKLPMEISKEWLKMVDKLGDGQFGEIHICMLDPVEPVLVKQPWLSVEKVAVKVLNKNADKRTRENFFRESLVLCRLQDPNLVQVVGVCTGNEPLCLVLEYTRHGDLCSFLKAHVLVENAKLTDANKLSYGCQLFIANQISSGMKYLESLTMVHRDLATRNCLVGDNCTIKISDLGMSRESYSSDYYVLDAHALLPIRWMSWEAVILGKFSSKSDVWSFAVTLWEILTLARNKPFSDKDDSAVIANCSHYYKEDGQQASPACPENCPKEIYDLMVECWSRDESLRPSFREVHMFLQRKNMGYDPRDDYGVAMSTKINKV